MSVYQQIASATAPLTLCGSPPGAVPLILTDLARQHKERIVFVAADDSAMAATAQIAAQMAPDLKIATLPAWDCLPYDRSSPSAAVSAARLETLHALEQGLEKGPKLVVTTANALIQRNLTPFRIRAFARTLRKDEQCDREALIRHLQGLGYSRTDTVADFGEYAVRGSIVDLYPSGAEHGLRLDFFGDEIETIRLFDPASQRTVESIESYQLLPASEVVLDEDNITRFRSRYRELHGAEGTSDPLYQAVSEGRPLAGMDHWLPLFEERLEPLFAHFDADDLILRDNGAAIAMEQRFEAIQDYYNSRIEAQARDNTTYRPLAPDTLYASKDELDALIANVAAHQLSPFHEPESDGVIDMGFSPGRDFAPERKAMGSNGGSIYTAVTQHIGNNKAKGLATIIASYTDGSRSRKQSLLEEHGLGDIAVASDWPGALAIARSGKTAMLTMAAETGFANDSLELLTEQDLLGDRLVRRSRKGKKAETFLSELATLSTGDLVVHVEHGIGRYDGLISIPVGESPHDCVALTYANDDRLYVPVENIDVLTRYGSDGEGASLDKLGGEAWQRRKSKLKDRIRAIAGELMKTAAARALRSAERIGLDATPYAAFVDRFPYEETEDQERVIAEVLDDLGDGKPMDRLVCGDVGFGKTEVAMRAAYAVAMSGLQVAVIAPTTLLARQHHAGFAERFRGFPVNVGRLSRLVPEKEAKATRAGIADGTVDIAIGTHALLAKSLDFKRLGLVIIDEEQKFGVTHKERLKQLKNTVHVLTLTATPIPRTLQMAMTGLRDLSVIQTPPVDRLAVRTYVMPWDPVVLREALLREHYRGGQSFLVVPRISDLKDMEEFLKEVVPEVKPITAHGQMSATVVEERMSAFYERKYDVLLSTTIVESGLDIPTANTLIIHRADRFGLGQLYQLRGRVGRSKTRAYAYFTTPENRVLTETAEKRLKVLSDLDSLGAGFQLASHDMDIRGAGNLVGDEQSGHVREVGFELYQAMLEEAIIEAKTGDLADDMREEAFSPSITVDAPILIPEDYVPDLGLRMALYRRLNKLEDTAAVEAFAAELIDRFGPIPSPTENLLKIMRIKLNCLTARISKIDVGPRGAVVTFHQDTFPNVPGLLAYVERLKGVAKIRPDQKLMIARVWRDPQSRLNGLMQLSRGLAGVASKAA
ncbi:transcription-repair coupling factor [Alterisphingorhabdus coralli]|uniref:Transcription-repair-coupling factor n=1 Tax=Alterisphingorhabdus coralli TaxID=3071408 RepID=A0AA97F4Y7_9SPHN|nr:transcription-repair coupling factor [Parasphingorhabdus sp. SCSIO 66989]WOE74113.1 transcription-repair coupling factor [Parasphingorhabdus sp. SCSIO 66989]